MIRSNALSEQVVSVVEPRRESKGKYLAKLTIELVYSETYDSRLEAMQREFQLKKWTKAKKEALVVGRIGENLSDSCR